MGGTGLGPSDSSESRIQLPVGVRSAHRCAVGRRGAPRRRGPSTLVGATNAAQDTERDGGGDALEMSGEGVAQLHGGAEGQGGAEMQGRADLGAYIEETRRLCGSLSHMLQKDAQAVHMAFHHTSGDVGKSNRSTVGLMITRTQIDSILPGGPAQGSDISKGDVIIAVDHQVATSENVSALLVGNDDPGVVVILTMKNAAGVEMDVHRYGGGSGDGRAHHAMATGMEMDVHITRMATEKIADRVVRVDGAFQS
ncbi:hypothetical protein T484DRAFT_1849667 [Baffinella frigidus]|nr:hypothetical protein T484DRAFT_1849667 [Cryptophyta sp. CCMP2293]